MKIHKKYISILTAATFLALSFSAFAEEVPSGISGMSEYESSESVDDSGAEQNIEQSEIIKTDGDALESDSGTAGQNTEQNKEKDTVRKEKSENQKFNETDNDNTEEKDEELKKMMKMINRINTTNIYTMYIRILMQIDLQLMRVHQMWKLLQMKW